MSPASTRAVRQQLDIEREEDTPCNHEQLANGTRLTYTGPNYPSQSAPNTVKQSSLAINFPSILSSHIPVARRFALVYRPGPYTTSKLHLLAMRFRIASPCIPVGC